MRHFAGQLRRGPPQAGHVALVHDRRDDAAQPGDALELVAALAQLVRHFVHVARAERVEVLVVEHRIRREGQVAEPGVRREHRVAARLGQVQRRVERLLRHVVDVDQHAALHHLLEQHPAVWAERALVGVRVMAFEGASTASATVRTPGRWSMQRAVVHVVRDA